MELPEGKFAIIYADPPWSYADKSLNRGGAARHYRTMTNKEIYDLPVKNISADKAVLFMWATFPKIEEALQTIKEWGFEYKTCAFVWVKQNKKSKSFFWGMGRWTRSNAEIVLLATRGGGVDRLSKSVHSIICEPIGRHSEKPDIVRKKIIELVGDLPRIELFARQKAEGWQVWGNEV
jgi:N6-adenosine-specific RNA methylase IME4